MTHACGVMNAFYSEKGNIPIKCGGQAQTLSDLSVSLSVSQTGMPADIHQRGLCLNMQTRNLLRLNVKYLSVDCLELLTTVSCKSALQACH